jgi:hypothetical protein
MSLTLIGSVDTRVIYNLSTNDIDRYFLNPSLVNGTDATILVQGDYDDTTTIFINVEPGYVAGQTLTFINQSFRGVVSILPIGENFFYDQIAYLESVQLVWTGMTWLQTDSSSPFDTLPQFLETLNDWGGQVPVQTIGTQWGVVWGTFTAPQGVPTIGTVIARFPDNYGPEGFTIICPYTNSTSPGGYDWVRVFVSQGPGYKQLQTPSSTAFESGANLFINTIFRID